MKSIAQLPASEGLTQRQRIQLAAIGLLSIMAIAIATLVLLGTRAASLNSEVQTLAGERDTLTKEVAGRTVERKALESDIQRLEQQKVGLEAETRVLRDTVAILGKQNPRTALAAERQAALVPRVYIQVASDQSEQVARRLSASLAQARFIVPRIERVRAVPRQPQVRYFSEADRELAGRVLQAVKSALPQATAVLFPTSGQTRMRDGHIELWF